MITIDEVAFADYFSDISLSLRSYCLARLNPWTACRFIVRTVLFDYSSYSRRGITIEVGGLK